MLGIMPMSMAWEPELMEAPKCWINAERWRRLEFTSINTLSGGNPRNDVERTNELPSPVTLAAMVATLFVACANVTLPKAVKTACELAAISEPPLWGATARMVWDLLERIRG